MQSPDTAIQKVKLAKQQIRVSEQKVAELSGRKKQIMQDLRDNYNIGSIEECEKRENHLIEVIEVKSKELGLLIGKLDEQIS